MLIEPCEPFRIHPEPDGTHCIRDDIAITVTPDVGEVAVKHRVGVNPTKRSQSRWLMIELQGHGLKIFVNGSHVLVTAKDYKPTFDAGGSPPTPNPETPGSGCSSQPTATEEP